jgi:aspartyl-tRNA(Asn)/glutamyl-tRNA(Gln) amidotransferase subunit C
MAEKKKSKPAFSIDTDMVKHVAYLVRLGIEEEEARAFSGQFTAIIDYFHLLNEVDTHDVPPATDIAGTRSVMREDEIRPSMSRDEFLKNVPHKDGTFVQVPLVFDEE